MFHDLSHCACEAHAHDRARFLAAMFVPEPAREALMALYALNLELARIPMAVSEEMLGFIRLAWWQEALDGLYTGAVPRGHPVLEALAPVIDGGHLPQAELSVLIEEYRTHFPQTPPDVEEIMVKLAVTLIRSLCPESEPDWRKAHAIAAKHRRRFGDGWNSWLALKLLVAGLRAPADAVPSSRQR